MTFPDQRRIDHAHPAVAEAHPSARDEPRDQPAVERADASSRTAPDESDHVETFVLKLTVDAQGSVGHAVIEHVRSGLECRTATWPSDEVEPFIAAQARLVDRSAAGGPNPPAAPASPDPPPPTTPPGGSPLVDYLDGGHLLGGAPKGYVGHVRLPYPRRGRGSEPMTYTITAYARRMGFDERVELGSCRGRGRARDNVTIDLSPAPLAPGLHRVELRLERDR